MFGDNDLGLPDVWGGIECTVNRVGDRYFDQIQRSGHADRPGDLERFAALGIRALRYPVLWERTAPDGLSSADWSWPDQRLSRLQALGIAPIVGLVHHGSGPAISVDHALYAGQRATHDGSLQWSVRALVPAWARCSLVRQGAAAPMP